MRLVPVTGASLFRAGWPLYSTTRQMLRWYFFGGAPDPVQIPLTWLSQPLSQRQEQPANKAVVSQPNRATIMRRNAASIARYRARLFTVTLDSPTTGVAAALADQTVTYQTPRMTSPRLVIDLTYRTQDERYRVLSIQIGDRIVITGTPPEYATGANSLVITGISRTIGVRANKIQFTTDPVLGAVAGVPGPWYRVGGRLDGTAIFPA